VLSTALLELTALVRVAGVGTAEISSVRAEEVSSVRAAEVSGVGAADVSSVEAAGAGEYTERLASTSALKHSKVSMSIVNRSCSGRTLTDKLTDNGSIELGYCEKMSRTALFLSRETIIILESSAFPTNGWRLKWHEWPLR